MPLPIISTLLSIIRARRFIVRGQSMAPVFQDGDCLLIDERAYHTRKPRRGEPVVLRLPHDKQAYLKRIVGLPGEWVRLEREGMQIEGKFLDEPYIREQQIPDEFIGQEWHLTQDDYLVLGDTRSDSLDSRRFGPVGIGQFEGPVLLRYWPPSRRGRVRP